MNKRKKNKLVTRGMRDGTNLKQRLAEQSEKESTKK